MSNWNAFLLGFILGSLSLVAVVVFVFALVRRASSVLR
jgi:hypothetical protein